MPFWTAIAIFGKSSYYVSDDTCYRGRVSRV